MNLDIIYEDNHIIVVNKPFNVPSVPDSSGDESVFDTVKSYIKEKYSKPGNVYLGIVQRLDRPVGGLLLFARTSKAANRLCAAIKENGVERVYHAIVHGKAKKSNTLTDYLLTDESENKQMAFKSSKPNAKEAILSYKTIDYWDNYSLLEITLKTGRKHQIRCQLANAGLPIFGDMKYGNDNMKGEIRLFSCRISFVHPVSKQPMEFENDYMKKVFAKHENF